jgi:hypothetical protein
MVERGGMKSLFRCRKRIISTYAASSIVRRCVSRFPATLKSRSRMAAEPATPRRQRNTSAS